MPSAPGADPPARRMAFRMWSLPAVRVCRAATARRPPTDRPDLLTAVPQQLEGLPAVSGGSIRSLDGTHTVLGLDPGPAEANRCTRSAPPGKAAELGAAERTSLCLLREPGRPAARGFFLGETVGRKTVCRKPAPRDFGEVGLFTGLTSNVEVKPDRILPGPRPTLPMLPPRRELDLKARCARSESRHHSDQRAQMGTPGRLSGRRDR
eukprot:15453933-Alexandrium_andersonii.AAC.1